MCKYSYCYFAFYDERFLFRPVRLKKQRLIMYIVTTVIVFSIAEFGVLIGWQKLSRCTVCYNHTPFLCSTVYLTSSIIPVATGFVCLGFGGWGVISSFVLFISLLFFFGGGVGGSAPQTQQNLFLKKPLLFLFLKKSQKSSQVEQNVIYYKWQQLYHNRTSLD